MSNATTKVCSSCGVEKTIDAFGVRASMPDGRRGQCLPCRVAVQRTWTRNNDDTERVHARERMAAWRAKNKDRSREINERAKANHPNGWRARNKVNHSITAGTIPPPCLLVCLDCGGAAEEYDHFLGYDPAHWLHVQAVCRRCHGKRRRKAR